ncbi:hypothetical protein D0Y65_042797 [Glycine soja]|uniref:Pectinesterase inhibitor domain-containing protein n=1 Tax=Glycine soja TaxID=3848 RepID=A0A445GEV3_GLYSO|nr:hypothetical protein D0Y65_042797 [Glycine soja]
MRPFLLRLESLVWVLVSVTPAENSLLLELLKAMVSSHQLKQKLQAFLQLLFGFHKWVSCMLFLNWIVSSCLIAPIRTTMRILSMGVLSSIVNSDSSLSLICRQANQVTHHLSKRLDARIVEIGNICSKHNNPNSCDNILRSVPGATSGVDLGSISLYLINMAHVNAFDTIGQISYNIRKATNTQTKQRYNSCIMDYDDVLLSLTQAKQSYNSGNYAALKSNGITVIEDVKDCDTKAYDLPQLRMNNQYLVDIKAYEEERLKKDKVITCLHSQLAYHIFTKTMDWETPTQVWDKIQDEFEGSNRVKFVRLLTLKKEFELMKMKDNESVKDDFGILVDVVNQMWLLGEASFTD